MELREPLGPGGERQAARLAPAVAREGALAQPTLLGGGCFRASLSTTSPASPGCRLAGFWCLTGCWLRADVVPAIHRAGYLQLPC